MVKRLKAFVIFAAVAMLSQSLLAQDTTSESALETILVNGESFDFSVYRGRVVYLDFWASWCGPCRQSFPWMNKLVATYPEDKFTVLAINLDEDIDSANEFLQELPADFKVLFDPSGTSATQLEVEGMPMSFLIGADGIIHDRIVGFSAKRAEHHERQIEALVEGK